jgi:HAD superfamily hydrolase (TIGR01509 family)
MPGKRDKQLLEDRDHPYDVASGRIGRDFACAVSEGICGRRVDAVLFDLFDTLVSVDESSLPVLRVGESSVPSTIPAVLLAFRAALPGIADADALSAMAAVSARRPPPGEPDREIPEHVLFAAVLRHLDVRDDADALARRLADAQMAAIVAACRPVRGARALLARLRERGLRTAVVSNLAHAGSLGALLAVPDPDHRFGAVVTSIEVGYCKPRGELFRLALERLGVEARHAIHVGDDPLADVAGAARAGIHPIWFNRAERPWPDLGGKPTTIASLGELDALLGAPPSMAV